MMYKSMLVAAGLKFKLKQNTGHGHILVKSDGLYVLRGTMIIIK